MAVQGEAALEVKEQVLAAALDALQRATAQLRRGQSVGATRSRSAYRELLAGEPLVQATGDPEDRVPLRHYATSRRG
jgi:hypothetical protein